MNIEQWHLIWRCLNASLSVSVLTLTLMDVFYRRRWTLRERFYWQATCLLFFSIIVSSIYGIAKNTGLYSVPSAITTVALSYFLLAIASASRSERIRVAKKIQEEDDRLALALDVVDEQADAEKNT